jgi:succinyl-diaminopimelate desuccinylase
MGIHALRFWRDKLAREGREFPVNVRVIFGCAEETGMADADYYLEHFPAPDFLFTPDADFPLCYGEKGQFQVRVTSKPMPGGLIVSFRGGTAPISGLPATNRWSITKITPKSGLCRKYRTNPRRS